MTEVNPRGRADLHIHTRVSDGTTSHVEVANVARKIGLAAVAFTDHDTTAGHRAALAVADDDLAVVTGAEFSTHVLTGQRRVTVHLLGYLFDPADPAIVAEQQRIQTHRLHRGVQMTEHLAADGLPVSVSQVLEIADGAPVGRPHIGQALVAAGVVTSVPEAFATVLSRHSRYFVAKQDTELTVALQLICAAGGVAVLAHPRARGAAQVLTPAYVAELAELGLCGLEVDHADHDVAARSELANLAADLGLLALGSSDYHGANKTIPLGRYSTDMATVAELITRSRGVGFAGGGL